jgi:TonB family protein
MKISTLSLASAVLLAASVAALAQSGAAGGSRAGSREYGVNLTIATYQYDESKSASVEQVTRLSGTFSSAGDEIAHMKDKYRIDEVANRHIRSVGLRTDETFNDAVLMGADYMIFTMTPRNIVKGHMKLELKVRYGGKPLLDISGVEVDNFETLMLRGGKGMFGLKFFVGSGGKQDSVPMERTLLLTVTPEIAPVSSLRNRPGELSQPVDDFGNPLHLAEGDNFTPPVPIERAPPNFDSGMVVRGAVLLGGVVAPDGKITNIRILRSLDKVIDDRAVAAFRQFKFSPAMLNGKPVAATYREEMTFAPPPPSILELEEQRRRMIEAEQEKEKQRKNKKKKWPI